MVLAADGCPQGEHLELLRGGQRLAGLGVVVTLRVTGSLRPPHHERACLQVAPGEFPEPGDLPGQWPGGGPGNAAPDAAMTA
jgi:hypothetical protein